MPQLWTFALPPSVNAQSDRVSSLRAVLGPLGCGFIAPSSSYEELAGMLERGDVHAAWAPPLVCARVERAGGRVVLQCSRGGSSVYRSALFSRRGITLSAESLTGKRAAWVDRKSLSGYLLPVSLLRGAGIQPEKVFREQLFLGSFAKCVDAVLDGRADVSSCFASPTAARSTRVGFMQLAGNRLNELVVLAYSDECPHDGVALSPALNAVEADALTQKLVSVSRDPEFLHGMDAEGMEVPPPGLFQDLLRHVGE